MSENLQALYNARLEASNITIAAATYAQLKPLPVAATAKLWPGSPHQPSIQINYLSPTGKRQNFYRIRLLGKPNGFVTEKPLRYLQPPSSGVRAYLPRVAKLSWPEVLADPTKPLIITEGEFKALATTLAGIPTIGLGGVENWRSAREGMALIEELSAVSWNERVVYICYDSDVATKPQVAVAAQRLADELAALGAIVHDAGLPASAGEKVGLDDYLISHGVRSLERHLSSSPLFKSVQALHEFNRRFVFIRSTKQVYELSNHASYDAAGFVNAVEVNAHYTVTKMTTAGPKVEKKATAMEWMKWPNRVTVQQPDYIPGREGQVISDEGQLKLNLWRGWGCEPKRGNIDLWTKLFDHLLQREDAATKHWFMQWLAYPLQNPGAKLYTAVAVWGATQGTGKTLIGETMLKIYGRNGQQVGARDLDASFNSWAQYKQFILGDEITGNDSRSHADELKGLITGTTIRVNEKFEKAFDLLNRINFYFTSNHPDAFFLDDKDRRLAVFEAPDDPLMLEFYEEYDRWLHSSTGPSALFYHLLRVDLKGFNPRAPAPRTHAKDVMIEQNKSDVGRFVAMVMLDPEMAERAYGVPASVELFTVAELFRYYDPRRERRASEKAVSLELQKQGAVKVLKGVQIQIKDIGNVRVYAVRNPAYWRKTTKEAVQKEMLRRKLPTAKY